jgi:hypothetical protein
VSDKDLTQALDGPPVELERAEASQKSEAHRY